MLWLGSPGAAAWESPGPRAGRRPWVPRAGPASLRGAVLRAGCSRLHWRSSGQAFTTLHVLAVPPGTQGSLSGPR